MLAETPLVDLFDLVVVKTRDDEAKHRVVRLHRRKPRDVDRPDVAHGVQHGHADLTIGVRRATATIVGEVTDHRQTAIKTGNSVGLGN